MKVSRVALAVGALTGLTGLISCIPIIVGAAAGSHAAKEATRRELYAAGQLAGKGEWQAGITLGPDLVISSIDPNGPAARVGVAVGDKILRVDGTRPNPPESVHLALYGEGGEWLRLHVQRGEEALRFRVPRRYLPGTEPIQTGTPYNPCPPPWEDLGGDCDPNDRATWPLRPPRS